MDHPIIYFDNAATSWPKPREVRRAMDQYLDEIGGNPGRAGHRLSVAAARVVVRAREALAGLLNTPDPSRIIFTKNATEALNLAILGLVGPGDHVVAGSLEHNAVMRPLRHLESQGTALTVVRCPPSGTPDLEEIGSALRPHTRLLVFTHASNVYGTLLPIADLARLARDVGVPLLVDAAQTAGCVPLDLQRVPVDLLALSGHKGLFGPPGTGALYLRPGLEPRPLMFGGTGSRSEEELQPPFLPDHYESGTLNVAGLAGLAAGIDVITATGVEAIRAHEERLVRRFLDGAATLEGMTLYGPGDPKQQTGVVSFNIAGLSPAEVGLALDEIYGIMARVGLHCAPAAHHTGGTFPSGTVRFGWSWFNTEAQVDVALDALRSLRHNAALLTQR